MRSSSCSDESPNVSISATPQSGSHFKFTSTSNCWIFHSSGSATPATTTHDVEETSLASPSPLYTFLKWQWRAERAKTSETPTQGRSEYLLINNTHSTAVRGLLPFCNPQLVEMVHMFALNDISYETMLHWDVATCHVSRCFGPDWQLEADVCRRSGRVQMRWIWTQFQTLPEVFKAGAKMEVMASDLRRINSSVIVAHESCLKRNNRIPGLN